MPTYNGDEMLRDRIGPCAEPRICPLCAGELLSKDIPIGPFNCKHCAKRLPPHFFPGYRWLAGLLCASIGTIWAWHEGHTGSFVVFFIGIYTFPVRVAWEIVVNKFFLPRQLDPESTYVPSIISTEPRP